MQRKWQLQEAKNRLSEVLRKAQDEGPQTITLRGNDAAVVVAVEEYRRLVRRPTTRLVEFFQRSPLVGVPLDLERSPDTGRAVDL